MQANIHNQQIALYLALHEMGHYVVARTLGFRTGHVWIEVTNEGGGGGSAILPEATCSLSEVKSYMERRVLVLFAGIIAEELQFQCAPPFVDRQKVLNNIKKREPRGDTDQAKISEILMFLFGLSDLTACTADDEIFQNQTNGMWNDFFDRAVNLVESNAAQIAVVALYLVSKIGCVPKKFIINAEDIEDFQEFTRIAASAVKYNHNWQFKCGD